MKNISSFIAAVLFLSFSTGGFAMTMDPDSAEHKSLKKSDGGLNAGSDLIDGRNEKEPPLIIEFISPRLRNALKFQKLTKRALYCSVKPEISFIFIDPFELERIMGLETETYCVSKISAKSERSVCRSKIMDYADLKDGFKPLVDMVYYPLNQNADVFKTATKEHCTIFFKKNK